MMDDFDWDKFWEHMGRISTFIFLMLTGIAVFFGYMYFTDSTDSPVKFLSHLMMLSVYKTQAITHIDDNVSIRISDFCGRIPMDQQADCVVHQVAPFYNYSMHNETVRSPDEYVEKGGVCRDSTVLYHSIFSRMGWYIQYDFSIPNHVFLIITRTANNVSMRCVVDGLTYNCEKYGGIQGG